jgi:hypothetical protein
MRTVVDWVEERAGVTLDWLREIPGIETAGALPMEFLERVRELPGMDIALALPRTWSYVARSMLPEGSREGAGEIPRPVATPGLALSVLADELVGAVMRSVRLSPPHEEIWRVAKELEVALRRLDLSGMLAEPERFHQRPPALERPLVESLRAFGQDYECISFESGYLPHADLPGRERWLAYSANRTARAYVLRHPGEPRPWVVCLHGFGMGAPRDLLGFRSHYFHRELGLNVIHPVFPLHGPRREGRFSGDGVISLDFACNLHGIGQAVWDVRRCLAWVRAQGAPALGLHGISLGGYTAALIAGLEDGLDCVIAGIPPADLPRVMLRHSPRVVRQLGKLEGLFGQAARDLHSVVSPLAFQPRLPRERLFIYAGMVDRMSTPRHAHMLWRHWQRPSIQWYRGSHVGFLWSSEVWSYVESALRRHLTA